MRDELWVSVVMAGILSLSSLARADAQTGAQRAAGAVNVVPIGPANATLNEEFSRLLSLRELSGGRVLLTDGKEKRVIVADFAANSVRSIGRAGDGPDEYRQVGRLWDIGGDSTFMSVPYASRWLVLHQDSIVHTFTGQLPIILKVGATVVRGADSQGNVLTIAWMVRTSDKYRTMPDSFTYVRTNRTSLKVDTVLKVVNSDKDIVIVPRAAVGTATPSPDKRQYSLALEARDQLAVFKDGTVAVLRGNPYRIDWCLQPGKPCAMGAPLAREVRSWRVADKSAYLKAMNALSAWPPTENIDQVVGWPDALPAFATPGGPDEANFWATASGNVVVERLPSASSPFTTYDVVDRTSHLVARVSVPPGHRVLGFGAKTVYSIRVDADAVQHLQRHAWSY